MGRDKMKSASLHSFHEEHAEPAAPASSPEARSAFESLVREMLAQLGEDTSREGLRQTPTRVEASLKWLTRGYHMSVADVIGDALYSERHENLVCVRDIEIYSLCEHHLLPFFGRAHVAYLPNGRLVGLSKIPRVIEVFARRLQVQERLTDQVADALMDVLDPRGVGVVIEAYHQRVRHLVGETLLHLEPAGKHLDHPWDLGETDQATVRQVGDVGPAEKGQQVVLAQRVDLDVAHADQVLVPLAVQRVTDHVRDGHVVAAGEPFERGLDAGRRLPEALPARVLAQLVEYFAHETFERRAGAGRGHRRQGLGVLLVEAVQAGGLHLVASHAC